MDVNDNDIRWEKKVNPSKNVNARTDSAGETAIGENPIIEQETTRDFSSSPFPKETRLTLSVAENKLKTAPSSGTKSPGNATLLLACAADSNSSDAYPRYQLPISEMIPQITPPMIPLGDPLSVSPSEYPIKKGVPHVYHDYSRVPDQSEFARQMRGGVTQPFPEKLYNMLTAEVESALVSWLPHGRAFIIRKPKAFAAEIMPKYFRQSKLTSFQRQLNLYAFRRITQGIDSGAYYHELFLRGRPQLCLRMNRQKVKGTGHKQPADAQTEPNFYKMPHQPGPVPMYPLGDVAMPVNIADNESYDPSLQAQTPKSPGLQGLHGAARLLKGMAAGLPPGALSSPLTQSAYLGSTIIKRYEHSDSLHTKSNEAEAASSIGKKYS